MKELFIAARSFILSISSTGCWRRHYWRRLSLPSHRQSERLSVSHKMHPYLWRFPERPPDPGRAVQSLGDTFAGAHSAHGVLWQRPRLDRDTCDTEHISFSAVASGWLCALNLILPLSLSCTHFSRSYPKRQSLHSSEGWHNTWAIQHHTRLAEKMETIIDRLAGEHRHQRVSDTHLTAVILRLQTKTYQ